MKQEDNTTQFSGLSGTPWTGPAKPPTAIRRALIGLTIGLFAFIAGCSGSGSDSDVMPPSDSVRVFAAASLTDAFGDLKTAFEAANSKYDIQLNLAGSATLRTQILGGAPADVFASANRSIMDEVVATQAAEGGDSDSHRDGDGDGDLSIFATNRLLIAVPEGNEAGVTGLADFRRSDLFLGLCAEGVPCGDLAAQVLSAAGIAARVDTYEPNVRALLAKVSARELDAGLVYATDVAADPDVEGVELSSGQVRRTTYPIAVMAEARSPKGAAAFVAFVLSAEGQRILADHGFGTP